MARTAAAHGARIGTRAAVTAVRADGVSAVDALTGAPFEVRAGRVVVGAGVWSGALSPGVSLWSPSQSPTSGTNALGEGP